MTNRKLGRGLNALLGVPSDPPVQLGIHQPEDSAAGELRHIAVAEIDANPYQPRRDFDPTEIASLAESIGVHGVVQPIAVRRVNERYQLIAGERRLRASQQAGLSQIPARVMELDERQTFEVALVENLQRADLNAIEKALAFQGYVSKFGVTHEELAGQLGVDRSTVTNLMRLLELSAEIQDAVRAGKISNGHARALLALDDPIERVAACRKIIVEGLSVRQTEAFVREQKTGIATTSDPAKTKSTSTTSTTSSASPKSNHLLAVENDLRQSLGTKVEIRPTGKDTGQIVLQFHSNDDFERIVQKLRS